jgi:hypothetical protein
MKNFIHFLSIIILFVVTFSSCTKSEDLPQPDNTNYIDETSTIEGVTWVLVNARIYRDNLTNGDKEVFDHFGGTQGSSCTNIFGSAAVPMDSIYRDLTTWTFNNGTFTISVGSVNITYPYNVTASGVSPYGMGGTARPIVVTHINETSMTVKVHEAFGSDGTDNFEWYSELTFFKVSTSCNNCVPDVRFGYTYSGVYQNTSTATYSLSGTKWVVTRYNNGLSGNVYPNDTLDFTSNTQYTINSGSIRNYTLSNVIGNNNKSLSLYSFTTLGGDYSGQVIGSFINDFAVNNTQMTDMFNVNNTVTIWMVRLQ